MYLGAVHLYENKGADDNYPGKWKWVGAPINASGAPGADHWNVKFADLNGDGRDDYMVVGDHGSLDLYLNTGSPGAVKPLWEPSGQVATGVGKDFTLADIDVSLFGALPTLFRLFLELLRQTWLME